MSGAGDGGTVLPLVVVSFLMAGLMVTAGTAASAAFLAQRDLAGVCDGAALAGAAALDRAALSGAAGDGAPGDGAAGDGAAGDGAAGDRAVIGREAAEGSGAVAGLPVSAAGVAVAVEDYRLRADRPGLRLDPRTDGATVTVTCRRTVRIPFGAVLGKANGLDRSAIARARTTLLPTR